MSILHVLLSSPEPAGNQTLHHWLGRGDRLPDAPDPRNPSLRALFRISATEFPVAALRHHVHAEDAAHGSWMCADPVYVRSEATGARLMAWPLPDIPSEEAHALATTLRPLFRDAGVPLTVDTPSAWCLHLHDGTPTANFTRPSDALGAGLLACLPAGEAGRRWRRLFNEAQVMLHAHPVNAARIAAGKLPVNALWFWGTGALPATVETGLTIVATRDDMIRGLAKLAQIVAVEPLPEVLEGTAAGGDGLLDLGVTELESTQWLRFFERTLRDRRFDAVELTFPGGERFRVRHGHRLRFWRRG
ncbi:MAG: phosphoglycerate mutase [Rhodanobacteraceae bacterium]